MIDKEHLLRILLLGEGAALHTLAWKLVSEPAVEELHCAPGNAGTALLLGPAPFPHLHAAEIAQWAFAQQVDLIIVQDRPDWVDTLVGVGLAVLGAGEREARALRDRQTIRDRLRAHALPLPPGQSFREREPAERYIASRPLPLWLRPNEAAGNETVRAVERLQALQQLARMLGVYAERGVYIEEEVSGPEVALGLLSDGSQAIALGVSRPFKRRYDGETGPMTEGMGAYAPYGDAERLISACGAKPDAHESRPGGPRAVCEGVQGSVESRLMDAVGRPLVAALQAEGLLRPGFLHLQIVLGPAGPVLRDLAWGLDDLHAVVTMPRWSGAAAGTLEAAARGHLTGTAVSWNPGIAVAVAVVVDNYPEPCPGGQLLGSIHDTPAMVWHHATRLQADTAAAGVLPTWLRPPTPPQVVGLPGQVLTTGGRALFVAGYADGAYEACRQAYQGVRQLAFDRSDWRQDIAAELL